MIYSISWEAFEESFVDSGFVLFIAHLDIVRYWDDIQLRNF